MTAARRASTPYARRLARERGIALAGVAGSGPNGRVVAADILAFTAGPTIVAPSALAEASRPPAAEPAVPVLPMAAMRSVGAFQARIDLVPLTAVIAASETGLAMDAFLLKAAARAAGPVGERLFFRDARGRTGVIDGAAAAPPSAIARRHDAGIAGEAALVVDCLDGSGIRPLASGLPPWAALKLVIVADAERAELLLLHDENAVASADAVAMLAAIRDLAEAPLRLLV